MKSNIVEDFISLFAIWYSNCCVLEVNENGIQAGRASEKRVPLSSSENHPKNQKVQRSLIEDRSSVLARTG